LARLLRNRLAQGLCWYLLLRIDSTRGELGKGEIPNDKTGRQVTFSGLLRCGSGHMERGGGDAKRTLKGVRKFPGGFRRGFATVGGALIARRIGPLRRLERGVSGEVDDYETTARRKCLGKGKRGGAGGRTVGHLKMMKRRTWPNRN